MSGLLSFPSQELLDLPGVEVPNVQVPEVPSFTLPDDPTLKAVVITILFIYYFKLYFPFLVAFTVEAQNTTFRQLVSNTKHDKWPVPVLGYLVTLVVLSTVASLLGYLVQTYVLVLSSYLVWLVVVLFLATAVFSFVRVDKLWKGHNAEHGDALLGAKGHGKSFLNVVLDILKVQDVEITQKTVLLLAGTATFAYVLVESVVAYLVLAVLAATVGAKLGESCSQKVFQILAGVSLLLWGVLLGVEAILLSAYDVTAFLSFL